MTSSLVLRAAPLAAVIVLGSITPGLAADAAAPGDMWEVTSRMSMEGVPMALPAQKVKVCSPKVWTEPPGGADERRKCTNSDFKLDGAKATWKVSCAGPPAMKGDGEITRESEDAWSGTIKFSSEDGAMTVKLGGSRLGDCEKPR
jgi:hypothetical protein